MSYIHPTAIVSPGAVIRDGAWIGPHVVIEKDVVIGAYSVIGGGPEHREFYNDKGLTESVGVYILEGARIFEFVSVHAGTTKPTIVRQGAAIFNHAHVAHDADVGQFATLGGHSSIAGFVRIMDRAIVGGMAAIHQKYVVGTLAIVGFGSMLKSHVPPGEKWLGSPARPSGLNDIGLERANMSHEECIKLWGEIFNQFKERSGI